MAERALRFLRVSANSRFSEARLKVLSERETVGGIGTLSEKLLHKILKFYAEPDDSYHEVPTLGSVADVRNDLGITEVQTRAYEKLLPKLIKFLPEYRTEVMLPLENSRRINYIDKDTGELIRTSKGRRHDGINRAACELYKLKELIPNKNLTVRVIFIDFDEYRYPKQKGKWQRRSELLIERIPTAIDREITLTSRDDYRCFLPEGLGETFTAKELEGLVKLDSRRTHNTLSLLLSLGILERERGKGNAFIYRRKWD